MKWPSIVAAPFLIPAPSPGSARNGLLTLTLVTSPPQPGQPSSTPECEHTATLTWPPLETNSRPHRCQGLALAGSRSQRAPGDIPSPPSPNHYSPELPLCPLRASAQLSGLPSAPSGSWAQHCCTVSGSLSFAVWDTGVFHSTRSVGEQEPLGQACAQPLGRALLIPSPRVLGRAGRSSPFHDRGQ